MMMLARVRLQVNESTCSEESCSVRNVHGGRFEL
jgi:hypothetical protein